MRKMLYFNRRPDSINTEIIGKTWKKLKILEKKNLFLIGNYDLN